MDVSFCGLNAKSAKLIKNMTSTEMMDTKVQHPKNVEKMRPSATTLVQRYTRNGKPLIQKSKQSYSIYFIETLNSSPFYPIKT